MGKKSKGRIKEILEDLLQGKITPDEACDQIHDEDEGGVETQDTTGDPPPTGPKPNP